MFKLHADFQMSYSRVGWGTYDFPSYGVGGQGSVFVISYPVTTASWLPNACTSRSRPSLTSYRAFQNTCRKIRLVSLVPQASTFQYTGPCGNFSAQSSSARYILKIWDAPEVGGPPNKDYSIFGLYMGRLIYRHYTISSQTTSASGL